jgi:hypothetical protein
MTPPLGELQSASIPSNTGMDENKESKQGDIIIFFSRKEKINKSLSRHTTAKYKNLIQAEYKSHKKGLNSIQ